MEKAKLSLVMPSQTWFLARLGSGRGDNFHVLTEPRINPHAPSHYPIIRFSALLLSLRDLKVLQVIRSSEISWSFIKVEGIRVQLSFFILPRLISTSLPLLNWGVDIQKFACCERFLSSFLVGVWATVVLYTKESWTFGLVTVILRMRDHYKFYASKRRWNQSDGNYEKTAIEEFIVRFAFRILNQVIATTRVYGSENLTNLSHGG